MDERQPSVGATSGDTHTDALVSVLKTEIKMFGPESLLEGAAAAFQESGHPDIAAMIERVRCHWEELVARDTWADTRRDDKDE